MYLLHLFKIDITKGNKNNVVARINCKSTIIHAKIISFYYGKYKKAFETYDNIVVISNYKYNKLHYSSKYYNILVGVYENKLMLYRVNNMVWVSYIQYKNNVLIYACDKSINNINEYYYVNKCLIKSIKSSKTTNYHYEKTEGYN